MGAAEWTGYTPSSSAGTSSAYSSYHHHHPHHHQSTLPPPPPTLQPPSVTNSSAATAASISYGTVASYDSGVISDHTNFHLPTVLTDMQPFCSTSDYHHTGIAPTSAGAGAIVPHVQPPICSPTYGSTKPEIDSLNAGYPSYNNWSNGYNNYQYGSCAAQAQYSGHTAPTMVLYPQLYSTVNQNQIHLHLHGTDKLEQYLGPENSLTISSIAGSRSGIEIGIGTSDHEQQSALGHDTQHTSEHQQQQHHHVSQQDSDVSTVQDHHRDDEVVDPGSVWRPY